MLFLCGGQILGVVETMSYFQCAKCGERAEIFGHGGARECAREMGMEFLGEVREKKVVCFRSLSVP